MNREKVLELARQAHLDVYGLGKDHNKFVSALTEFASLIEAEVHEKNARLCDSLSPSKREFDERFYDACHVCADAIRSQA